MENQELPLSYRTVFQKLKSQVDTSLRSGLHTQSVTFIEEFANHYLQGLGILTQIRAHPHWQRMLQPCQKLLIQANLILYPEAKTSSKSLWHGLWVKLPAQLWESRYYHLFALGIILVTGVLAFIMVRQNFEMAAVFMPPFLRSTHELEAYLFTDTAQQQMLTANQDMGIEQKSFFASFLLFNNTRVAVICFLMGFLYGIPTFLVLVQTGLMAGTLPALFNDSHSIGLWAWILPHGVPEFSAIILAGGAGLRLGYTMLAPGEEGLGIALKKTLRSLSGTVLVCVALLIWAAIVESFIRQSHLSNEERLMIAWLSLIPLFLLFLRAYLAHQQLQAEQQQ